MNYFDLYADSGLSVLPIKTDGSKSPAVSSWAEYQIGIAPLEVRDGWSGYGVAVIGGRVSGGLEVIDIDDPSLARPFFAAVREASPSLVESLAWVATPRRDSEGQSGMHVYYRCENPEGNQKLAMTEPLPVLDEEGNQKLNPVTNQPMTKPETLIETRGEGGYVLTVGCPGKCHPAGNEYTHKFGCQIFDLPVISAKDRALLFRVASSFDRSAGESYEHHPQEHGADTPGNQFAASTSWDEILTPHGWERCGRSGDVDHWRRPGKTKGTSATTGLKSNNGSELFCVFSSNAHPFPGPTSGSNCSTHSKFDTYARLNFDGDHSACAKHLVGRGFGDREKMRQEEKEHRPPITFQTLDNITMEYFDIIERGGDRTLETGIQSLDYATGGIGFGEVCIIGGRPSHGKTLLALQIVDYFSQCGYSPLVFSEEMGDIQLAKRRIQMLCEAEQEHWLAILDKLREEYWTQAKLRSPVYIAPKCGSVEKVAEVIEEAATKHELNIMVIDYAQLLRGKGNTRYEQVTDISQRIRELTSKHNLLTLLLCQLNRANERANDAPQSTDLRDSGQLEQDADQILLVDWRARRDGDWKGDRYDYFVYVKKNRNRMIKENEVKLRIDPERQRLTEVPHEWTPTVSYAEVLGGDF